MKKALVYFLVSCFIAGAAVTEVFKAPLLLSHYVDHISRNPKVGFIEFLSMHYWGNDIRDHDRDQDLKLPFKKIFHGHQQVLFCHLQVFDVSKSGLSISDELQFFYLENVMSPLSTKLYRPPKYAFGS